MVKFDHVHLNVHDMDRAIAFYEKLFGVKVQNRYKDRWADLQVGKTVYIGLYRPTFDNENSSYEVGTNVTPVLRTKDIKKEYMRISDLKPKTVSQMQHLNFIRPYDFFMFEDPEGNVWEVAQY
ncbi:MAG: VOC family protein [Candidatus Dojkabacteria bacterium]|nr:VOC family protein [Candidatus Dojkabacteria bacterium]